MNTEEKKSIINEKINEINFNIQDILDKITVAQQEGSEYALKLEGYNVLLNDYISKKSALQDILDSMI